MMLLRDGCAIVCLALTLAACTTAERNEANREARETGRELKDATNGAAKKAGRAAYEIKEDTKEAAKKAGKAIDSAARDIREGWNEAAREDRKKDK